MCARYPRSAKVLIKECVDHEIRVALTLSRYRAPPSSSSCRSHGQRRPSPQVLLPQKVWIKTNRGTTNARLTSTGCVQRVWILTTLSSRDVDEIVVYNVKIAPGDIQTRVILSVGKISGDLGEPEGTV